MNNKLNLTRFQYLKMKWLERMKDKAEEWFDRKICNIAMKQVGYIHYCSCPKCHGLLVKDYFMHMKCSQCDYTFNVSPNEESMARFRGISYEDTQVQPVYEEYSIKCKICKILFGFAKTEQEAIDAEPDICPICHGKVLYTVTREWIQPREREKFEANLDRQVEWAAHCKKHGIVNKNHD